MKRKSSGSAILAALGFGIILLIVIGSLQTFSSQRMRTTTKETQNLVALGVAEAGLHLVMNELRADSAFRTHKTKANGDWDTEETHSKPSIKADAPGCSDHGLSVQDLDKGAYKGTIGGGSFKVRCGLLPLTDDPNTKNVDESKAYFKVEAIGKVDKTYRKITATLEKKFLGREYLLYDGGFLSTVYGLLSTTAGDFNAFTTGHIYGHLGVEIGQITDKDGNPSGAGTKSQFFDIEEIRSGVGGIFVYNPVKFEFRNKDGSKVDKEFKTFTFPNSPTFEDGQTFAKGGIPKEMIKFGENSSYSVPDDVLPFFKDGKTPNSITPVGIDWGGYKKLAEDGDGLLTTFESFALPSGVPTKSGGAGPEQVCVLDFGDEVTGRPEKNVKPATKGVFFCANSIVLRGNPKKDFIICSEGNIYLNGDFNQRGDPAKGYNNPEAVGANSWDMYGFPQDYDGRPFKPECWNYTTTKNTLPGKRINEDTSRVLHRNIGVYAKHRIIFDYRNGIYLFENEIFPYIKYLIAKIVCNDPDEAGKAVMDVEAATKRAVQFKVAGASTPPTTEEDLFVDELKSQFAGETGTFSGTKVTEKYAILDAGNTFFTEAKTLYTAAKSSSSTEMKGTDLHKIAQAAMKAIREKCEPLQNNEFRKLMTFFRKEIADQDAISQFAIGGAHNIKNFIYFPEMTINAMLVSCAKRKANFYLGPDEAKHFDEIGNKDVTNGKKLFDDTLPGGNLDFIQRVFGSEVRLATTDVNDITGDYKPGLRRKIYDASLPILDVNDPTWEKELAAYRFVTWRDYASSESEFTNFD